MEITQMQNLESFSAWLLASWYGIGLWLLEPTCHIKSRCGRKGASGEEILTK